MKILILTTAITDSGGVSSILCQKANALSNISGIEIAIASTNDFQEELFFGIEEKVHLYFLKTKMKHLLSLQDFYNELKNVIGKFQPDVISVADNGLKSFFVKRMFPNLPVVYEIHANEEVLYSGGKTGIPSKITSWISKSLLPSFDQIVIQNRKFNLPKNTHSTYIPNFISKSEEISFSPSNKIIAVGRVVSTKNYLLLLEIWEEITAVFPEKELHIFGSWDDDDLVKKIRKVTQVFLHQPTVNISDIYKDAYVLLHASYIESFPMVFLEAMFYGVPVVCFDVNQPELVLHDKTGFVVKKNDKEMFIKYVFDLIKNPDRRTKCSEQSMEYSKQFSKENIVTQWVNLFQEVIKNKKD